CLCWMGNWNLTISTCLNRSLVRTQGPARCVTPAGVWGLACLDARGRCFDAILGYFDVVFMSVLRFYSGKVHQSTALLGEHHVFTHPCRDFICISARKQTKLQHGCPNRPNRPSRPSRPNRPNRPSRPSR